MFVLAVWRDVVQVLNEKKPKDINVININVKVVHTEHTVRFVFPKVPRVQDHQQMHKLSAH